MSFPAGAGSAVSLAATGAAGADSGSAAPAVGAGSPGCSGCSCGAAAAPAGSDAGGPLGASARAGLRCWRYRSRPGGKMRLQWENGGQPHRVVDTGKQLCSGSPDTTRDNTRARVPGAPPKQRHGWRVVVRPQRYQIPAQPGSWAVGRAQCLRRACSGGSRCWQRECH